MKPITPCSCRALRTLFLRFFWIASILFSAVAHLSGQSTIHATQSHAWSANTGWIQCRPSAASGVVFGDAYLSGYAWSGNIGWIFFGDGSPANGHAYGNDAGDTGVNHDGEGGLSGYAWSANAGWLNFHVSGVNRPRVDLDTGEFSGYVWSANLGWIHLGGGNLITDTMSVTDSDGDGISDAYEYKQISGLDKMTATSDYDGDGSTDLAEYFFGTDPFNRNERAGQVDFTLTGTDEKFILDFATLATRRYSVQVATDFSVPNPWANHPDHERFAPDPDGTTTRTILLDGAPTRLFRVVSELPLQP